MLDELFGIGQSYEHSLDGWAALIHPDDRAMMSDYLKNEAIGQGRNFNKEYRIVPHKDRRFICLFLVWIIIRKKQ